MSILNYIYTFFSTFTNKQTQWRLSDGSEILIRHMHNFPRWFLKCEWICLTVDTYLSTDRKVAGSIPDGFLFFGFPFCNRKAWILWPCEPIWWWWWFWFLGAPITGSYGARASHFHQYSFSEPSLVSGAKNATQRTNLPSRVGKYHPSEPTSRLRIRSHMVGKSSPSELGSRLRQAELHPANVIKAR